MRFFEKLFNTPEQPSEDEVIKKLGGLKRDVLLACKEKHLNQEGTKAVSLACCGGLASLTTKRVFLLGSSTSQCGSIN